MNSGISLARWTKVIGGRYSMKVAGIGEYVARKVVGPGGGVYWVVTLNEARIPGGTGRTLADAKLLAELDAQSKVAPVEPAPSFHECGSCSEPMPVEDGELCETCEDEASPAELELVVIPCSADKLDQPAPARELYSSAHFRFQLEHAEAYANRTGARVMILSARHGLVELDTVLAPYDQRVDELDEIDEASLIDTVTGQLAALCSWRDGVVRAWLPAAYRDVMTEAVDKLDAVELYDELAGCRGIGEQRARMARLGRGQLEAVVETYADDAFELPRGGVGRDLIEAADRLEAAQLAVEAAKAELAKLAAFAVSAGKSEAWVSRTTGIRRGTLRAWLGKPET